MKFRIGECLRRRAMSTNQRLTMTWLAQYTGISTNTLYRLGNGTSSRVHLIHLDALCSVLACTPDQLLEVENIPFGELPVTIRNNSKPEYEELPAEIAPGQ